MANPRRTQDQRDQQARANRTALIALRRVLGAGMPTTLNIEGVVVKLARTMQRDAEIPQRIGWMSTSGDNDKSAPVATIACDWSSGHAVLRLGPGRAGYANPGKDDDWLALTAWSAGNQELVSLHLGFYVEEHDGQVERPIARIKPPRLAQQLKSRLQSSGLPMRADSVLFFAIDAASGTVTPSPAAALANLLHAALLRLPVVFAQGDSRALVGQPLWEVSGTTSQPAVHLREIARGALPAEALDCLLGGGTVPVG